MRETVVAVVVACLPVAAVAAAPPHDLAKADVCAVVPGAEVAKLAGGTLAGSKRFNAPDGKLARCVYSVLPAKGGAKDKTAWVVELFPAETFAGVRPYIAEPVRSVTGLGDDAYEFKDRDSGRWRVYAHRRGGVTISVTGTDPSIVHALAAFALSR